MSKIEPIKVIIRGILVLGLLFPSLTLAQVTVFRHSPLLVRSSTSFRNPAVLANYHFTISIPETAEVPLKTVTIIQQPNVETIALYPEKTRAFFGDSFNGGTSVEVEGELIENNGIKVTFPAAISPGKTVTVVLRARNPLYGGIYQFGVTVFPKGEGSQGLYLGIGRLHFSQPGGGFR